MARFIFGKKKTRSSGHQNQLAEARAAKTSSAHDGPADKENIDPAPLYRKIDTLEGKLAMGASQLDLEKEKTAEARARCQNTRRREERGRAANVALRDRLKSSETLKDDLLAAQLALNKLRVEFSALLTRNSSLVKRAKALSMRIRRAPTTQARAVAKVKAASHLFKLKEKGVISEASRELVTDLVSLHNVPVSRVLAVIRAVADTVGMTVAGDISERSVGRIVLEGGLISQAQIVHEIQKAACEFDHRSSNAYINFG